MQEAELLAPSQMLRDAIRTTAMHTFFTSNSGESCRLDTVHLNCYAISMSAATVFSIPSAASEMF